MWAPVAALLVLSIYLDEWYWSAWKGGDPPAWLLWAAWLSWWAGLALLPVYVVLAMWSPARSLHDRLAGTYLVPR